MAKLKFGVTAELPAAVYRDLVAYAEIHDRETGQPVPDPARLIAPVIARFISTDRGLAGERRKAGKSG